MIERELTPSILKLIDRPEILLIRGARRTGKTTLLEYFRNYLLDERQVPAQAVRFISFEDFETREQFEKNTMELMRFYLEKCGAPRLYLLLDEVQYVNGSGHLLKWIYDEFKDRIKLIVTGSSSLEIREKTMKYLVGRSFLFELYPFSFREFLSARDPELFDYYKKFFPPISTVLNNTVPDGPTKPLFLERVLKYYEEYSIWGGYPEVVVERDPEIRKEILKNIYQTYITRDIIEFLRMKNLERFRKVVVSVAANTGGITNFSSLSVDTGSYLQELKNFLQVLEETFVIRMVYPFFKNISTEIRKTPKVYFVDNGLRNYIVRNFNGFELREDFGELVEANVMKRFLMNGIDFNFWRTTGKAEVDFVLMEAGRIVPVEVKYRRKRVQVGKGFRNFVEKYNVKYGFFTTRNVWETFSISDCSMVLLPSFMLS